MAALAGTITKSMVVLGLILGFHVHAAFGGATTGTSSCANVAEAGDEGVSLLALRSKVKKLDVEKKRVASLAQQQADLQFSNFDHMEEAGQGQVHGSSEHFEAHTAVTQQQRKTWLTTQEAKRAAVEATEGAMTAFIASIRSSGEKCASQVLKLYHQLQELTASVKAMAEQMVAHQAVLTSATDDLAATNRAIDDANQVYDDSIDECEQRRAEAATKFVEYTNELDELAQIGNPSVRAEMANYGQHALEVGGATNASYTTAGADGPEAGDYAAAAAAAEQAADKDLVTDEDAADTAVLLQTGATEQKKMNRPGSAKMHGAHLAARKMQQQRRGHGPWSKQKCVAFLHFKQGRRRMSLVGGRQPNGTEGGGNATAAEAPAAAVTAPTEEACETQLQELQVEYEQAYNDLNEMKELKGAEKISKQCDELAQGVLDAALVPLTTQREHASDKIEDSNAAVSALNPVVSMREQQLSELKAAVVHTKTECTDAQQLESHLTSVSELIISTANCPGVAEVFMATPADICHTNGLTCSWTCSSRGQIFKTGEEYGQLNYIYVSPEMAANEPEVRAYCEKQCVEDINCVGFVHHHESASSLSICLTKTDVLDGGFSPLPNYQKTYGDSFPLNSLFACFVQQRVELVNQFRDPTHPKMGHEDVNLFWQEHNSWDMAHDHFHNEGLDEASQTMVQNVGQAVTATLDSEPQFGDSSELPMDACGCMAPAGWCHHSGGCEGGMETDQAENDCCAGGGVPGVGAGGEMTCTDQCGCAGGQGWSSLDQQCADDRETDQNEAACCFFGKVPQRDDSGEKVCLDACGCGISEGWCGEHQQCETGEETDAIEADCCNQGKIPGASGGENGSIPSKTCQLPEAQASEMKR